MQGCIRGLTLLGSLIGLALTGCEVTKAPVDTEEPLIIDTAAEWPDEDTDTSGGDDALALADVGHRLHGGIESLVYVSWEQSPGATVWVEYSFDEGEWLSTPAEVVPAGEQEHLLLGIPYAADVTYRIANSATDSEVVEYTQSYVATTGPFPSGLPKPNLLVNEPKLQETSGKYLYSSINADTGGWTGGDYWQFIMDRKGRVVWALETDDRAWTIYVRVSEDGEHLLWDSATYWNDYVGADSMVHRMSIDGTIVESYPTPGLHHAFTELPDETIIWGAAAGRSETLEKLNPDGSQETIWDCDAFHNSIGSGNESCQSNALYWHEATDSFLYSFYTTSTLVHIDHATGETLHYWGKLSDWAFDPTDAEFDWQHGATWTDEGTLLLSTHVSDSTSQCATREYTVDDKTETLTEVWSHGVDEGLYCNTAGEAHRLPNGNTLHNHGSGSRTREITPDGELAWDVKWPDGDNDGRGRLQGRSVFIEDLYAFAH